MAASLAARIHVEFGIKPELIRGGGGIYELTIDGTVVFTHRGSRSRIPEDEKLLQAIRKNLPDM